jgi:hypothetical protein
MSINSYPALRSHFRKRQASKRIGNCSLNSYLRGNGQCIKSEINSNNSKYTIYSGVNGCTRAKAGVMIWIHNSIRNTAMKSTHLSEELNIGRGKLSFLDPTPQKKEELKKTTILQRITGNTKQN